MRFPKAFWPDEPHFIGYVSDTLGEFPEFLNVRAYGDAPVLMAFTGGDFARGLEERGEAAVTARIVEILRTIYGDGIPDPEAVVMTSWASDPFAGGSYSHVRVGGRSKDYDVLAAPVGERLFFAGEATSRAYRATVHGAYLSGRRAARRIAKLAAAPA